MPKSFVKDVDKGWKRMIKDANSNDLVVKIGVQGRKALDAKKTRVNGMVQLNPEVDLVSVATFHEFGVDSGKVKIPERSFLRGTLDANRAKYKAMVAAGVKDNLLGKLTKKDVLSVVGAKVQSDIQKRIANGIAPANAQSTIDKKGSSKPLIDTGQLRQSITWVVEPKGFKE